METLKGMQRSHHSGELRKSDVGAKVVLCGMAIFMREQDGGKG